METYLSYIWECPVTEGGRYHSTVDTDGSSDDTQPGVEEPVTPSHQARKQPGRIDQDCCSSSNSVIPARDPGLPPKNANVSTRFSNKAVVAVFI
ncbi:hypothetical protein RRG08_052284 [Elysia crispata]|uniref:Uncharacterized protein n=1 Tax=Elysia crispata TaxID=231223 RepID=A0AAE1A0U7_9GAST|nr:hypothetical protein RRG08_052284 [Elysia crispata]